MYKSDVTTFEALFYAETISSIAVLCIKGDPKGDSWNTLEWFPRSICSFSEKEPYGKIKVTAPNWLLKTKKIHDKVTTVNSN